MHNFANPQNPLLSGNSALDLISPFQDLDVDSNSQFRPLREASPVSFRGNSFFGNTFGEL